ncbi:MAG: acyl-CoA dehydrogenase family protein [Actinomycetota bacterium]
MDFKDSPSEAAVRSEARAFLEARFPSWRASNGDPPYSLEQLRSWQRVLCDEGWGAPAWPVEYGGRGFGPLESAIWAEEKSRAGANMIFATVGFGMAGPTIIAHGSQAQRARYLTPLLRGDEIWCQLFSEPGAGSDLASLKTRAERVREPGSEGWIVNGQKVWCSGATDADFGILLARYDFNAPKHKGLIYFLLDMHSQGVEVRPLRQINGEAHFSEVFLTDVRIPNENVVEQPGDGWRVALTTLMFERFSIGSTEGITFPFRELAELAQTAESATKTTARDDLVNVYMQERIMDLLIKRVLSKLGAGQIPTAEGSVLKLALARLGSDAANLGMRLLGANGTIAATDGPQNALLWSPAMHIGGGTDEVLMNQIAERVLGLPADDRPDKTLPFNQVRA